jgi:UDPglucose 6-dehydrogenase
MGTTIKDFTQPEFVLFGVDDQGAYETARDFYATIHDRPVYKCTIEEAEMIKVSYNTYITMKICLANIIMEVAHKSENVNCDNVMDGLFLATERLISTKYMQGGMGDGGGCHPRDNIALSWLARKLDVSYDWYESLMICREKQTDWLADLMEEHDLPKVIMGRSFKPETNLILGSPAILLENILVERGHEVTSYDPKLGDELPAFAASCFLIGCKHEEFKNFSFPQGSVVIDPHRYIADQDGITVIRVGG